jgi:hypothetical protein
MKSIHRMTRICALALLATVTPAIGFGQVNAAGGVLGDPAVLNAPFSAEATTTVWQTLDDGTRIERRAKSHYDRDSLGRVRVEQLIADPKAMNPAADRQMRITIHPDPAIGWVYTLDPATQTAQPGPRSTASRAVGGGSSFAVPLNATEFLTFQRLQSLVARAHLGAEHMVEEALGSRRFEGVETTGRRFTLTIPAGHVGNERPIEVVEERWESPELRIVLYSRSSDPRTGIVEYRVSNIQRGDPPSALFRIPDGYTIGPHPDGDDSWITLHFAEPLPWERRPKRTFMLPR